jgi:acyl-CoA synthetase (AMP-forming)/AMP-acid ligase II
MAAPLALAAPATAAGLAYLDAKLGLRYDGRMMRGVLPAAFDNFYSEWKDRCNIFWRLEQRALDKSSANRPFLLYGDKAWTYAQTYETALKYGEYLKNKFNLKPRDIVALDLPNSDHFVLITFGLWAIGAKPAFINYNLTGKALAHCVKVAKAVLMLVDPEVAENVTDDVQAELDGLRIELLKPELQAEMQATSPVRPPDEVRSGDLSRDMAILIYTSGTTGLPKAAIISWAKIIKASAFIAGWLATKPDDVFYTASCYRNREHIPSFC